MRKERAASFSGPVAQRAVLVLAACSAGLADARRGSGRTLGVDRVF